MPLPKSRETAFALWPAMGPTRERKGDRMAEFNPFDIPEENVTGKPAEASQQQPRPQQPQAAPPTSGGAPVSAPPNPRRPKGAGPAFLDKLPKNGFGKFVRRYWGALAGVIVVVLVVLIFGSSILTKLSPVTALGRATAKTSAAIQDRIDKSPYKAVQILGNSLMSGSVGCGVSYDDGHSRVNGQFNLNSDWENQAVSLGASGSYNGQSMDAELFLNNERAAFRSSLLQDCYGATFATLEDDLRASFLPDALGLSDEEIRQAGQAAEMVSKLMDLDLTDLLKQGKELYADFLDGIQLESDSAKTEVGGKRLSCTAVYAEVDEKDLMNLTMDLYDLYTEDEDVRNLVVSSIVADGYYTVTEAEQQYDQQVRNARQQLEQQMRRLDCDMELTYFLHSNQLVKVEVAGEMTVDGTTVNTEMYLDFGEDPEKDDWTMECVMTSGYGDKITMNAVYSTDVSGADYKDSLEITLDEGYGAETVGLYTDWDRKSGDLAISLDNGDDYQTGYCNLVVDGDTFTLTLDDLAEAMYMDGIFQLEFTADQSAVVEDPDFINLNQWDQAVLEEFQSAANKLAGYDSGYAAADDSYDW